MEAKPMNHPAPEVLRALAAGKLEGAAADAAFAHLESCPACRESAAALSGDSFLRRLRAAHPSGSTLSEARGAGDTQGSKAGTPTATHVPPAVLPELRDHPQYEVVRELGRGGMGVVYLARNKLMDRPEVLKVVGKHLLDRPGAAERFQREIRSAARLSDPHIVAAHAAFQAGDLLVFAMEYVEGETLAEVVNARGQLPVVNACFYAQQVAQGLQHACDRGMVHRDIKPQNLILARQGKKHTVKILDFGLAKATQEGGPDDHGLTGSGAMLGTPDYIAPEQTLDAAAADIRADIYSLGCTLYFLLSGAPPFHGKSTFEILQAHLSKDATALDRLRADVPAELAAVVAKMMAKDPARRYQKPAEVAQALAPFMRSAKPVNVSPGADTQIPDKAKVQAPLGQTPLGQTPLGQTLLEERRNEPQLSAPGKRAAAKRWPVLLAVACGAGVVVIGVILFQAKTPTEKNTATAGKDGNVAATAGKDGNVAATAGKDGNVAATAGKDGATAGKDGNVGATTGKDGNVGATAKKVPANLRTSANGIDYEVAGSRWNGRVWELTLSATKTRGNRGSMVLWGLQVTTEEGKEFQLPPGKVTDQILLAQGKPVPIKITMSTLPTTVKKLARVVLIEHQSAFGQGADPIVFVDVPIEPDQEVGQKVPANLRTTANFVDYEVAGSRWNGRVWELTLSATKTRGNRGSLVLWTLQVTTEDGKEFQLPPGKVMDQTLLADGKPVPIKITMSTLPPNVKKLSKVVLVERQAPFSPGTEPIVFLDVPIEPDPDAAGGPPGDGKKK